MASVAVPVFVSVTGCTALIVPTVCSGNPSEVGVKDEVCARRLELRKRAASRDHDLAFIGRYAPQIGTSASVCGGIAGDQPALKGYHNFAPGQR